MIISLIFLCLLTVFAVNSSWEPDVKKRKEEREDRCYLFDLVLRDLFEENWLLLLLLLLLLIILVLTSISFDSCRSYYSRYI